ncbi:MAG: site-specific tyrosine recombinase XerC [Planctomycetes bacterium]|nr:site-specific tyrosine recombinase XerC [Planctomycetota bacterium]
MNSVERMSSLWLEYLRVRNYSPHSIDTHAVYLRFFNQWCHERSLLAVNQITKAVLERYQRWLFHYRNERDKPLSFYSQAARLYTLRAFFKWLARENHILFNPAGELEVPKVPRRIPRNVLSLDEVKRIANMPDIKTPLGIRDRAIIETFFSTGIRRAELIKLNIYDINFDAGWLMIREGKGKKDRLIPIGERARQWVERYLRDVRPTLAQNNGDVTLFLTHMGKPFLGCTMSALIKRYCEAAKIIKPGSCHMFRHTMATQMLENGADIRFIQAMLGHTDLSTTEIYTAVSIKKLKEVYERTHPG